MTEREQIVAALVAANGGRLTGRVRLQKTLYLLEQLGFGTDMPFEYHHYGPYSRELDNATSDAKTSGIIDEKLEHRQSDGAMYSIFVLNDSAKVDDGIYAHLGKETTTSLVGRFSETNVTVLELAATVDWLWRTEKVQDWKAEITRRKGKKVLGGRLEKAVELLKSLELQPPPVSN